jgi:hypothetical protein
MAQSHQLEKISGKAGDGESRPEAESINPNSRFKNLAQRLVNVPREEVLAKEKEWKDQKT